MLGPVGPRRWPQVIATVVSSAVIRRGVLSWGRAAASAMCLGREGWGRRREGGDQGGHVLSLRIGR